MPDTKYVQDELEAARGNLGEVAKQMATSTGIPYELATTKIQVAQAQAFLSIADSLRTIAKILEKISE